MQDNLAGLLAHPEPVVRFIPGFGPSSLDFTLYVQVSSFHDQFPVQSELRKRILARFQREGIEMPFPTQTVIFQRPAPEDREKSAPAEAAAQTPKPRGAGDGDGSPRNTVPVIAAGSGASRPSAASRIHARDANETSRECLAPAWQEAPRAGTMPIPHLREARRPRYVCCCQQFSLLFRAPPFCQPGRLDFPFGVD